MTNRESQHADIGATHAHAGAHERHPDLNMLPLPDLFHHLAKGGLVRRLLELARDEDLGSMRGPVRPGDPASGSVPIGDITTQACIGPGERCEAALVARAGGVISGLEAVPDILSLFATDCHFETKTRDGQHVPPGTVIGVLSGPMDEVLETERTLLNLVGRLSGIATRTAEFARAIETAHPGVRPRARLYDTRKTTPGLRVLEKYAVRCGGGFCHRIGLYDAMLIKDNHLAGVAAGELGSYVRACAARARSLSPIPLTFIEVEVDSLEQFEALLDLAPGTIDIVLLDNMGPPKLREAAARRDARAPRLQLEASGGINLQTIGEISRTGVDRISTGSVTHSVASLDVALDVTRATRSRR